MRAIGDPDAFLPTDLGLRRAASYLGLANDAVSLTRLAERWRPWRAYALAHLWSVAGGGATATEPEPEPSVAPQPGVAPAAAEGAGNTHSNLKGESAA